MGKLFFLLTAIVLINLSACAPIGSMTRHELGSGYYNLKSEDAGSVKDYADVYEDSLVIYQLKPGASKEPDPISGKGTGISTIDQDSYLYGSRFI